MCADLVNENLRLWGLYFKDKLVIDRVEGAHAAELTKKVAYHVSSYVPVVPQVVSETSDQQVGVCMLASTV